MQVKRYAGGGIINALESLRSSLQQNIDSGITNALGSGGGVGPGGVGPGGGGMSGQLGQIIGRFGAPNMTGQPVSFGVPGGLGSLFSNEGTQPTAFNDQLTDAFSPGFNMGGFVQGPGDGTSDSIPAMIYQDGQPVQEARLSNNEFVMTENAVNGAGGAAKMYELMKQFEAMA